MMMDLLHNKNQKAAATHVELADTESTYISDGVMMNMMI